MPSSSVDAESGNNNFLFVEYIPKTKAKTPQTEKGTASRRDVRAQAARVSSTTRLTTIRKRFAGRTGPGDQRVLPVHMSEPFPLNAVEQHQEAVTRYQDREVSVTAKSYELLGGSIPAAQAKIAILGQFLYRFKTGQTAERPWVELVMDEASSSTGSSLVAMALQANASALCANDLQQPEMHSHATKQYLWTITQLQTMLNGPKWRSPAVMYTCMILTLYECIQSNNTSARHAHVSGVAHLIRQKGPQSFTRGLEHKTFRYYRINILMMALVDCQPTFLAENEWKIIPFSGDCPPKTILERLMDILVEFPAVLATIKALRTGELTRYTLIQKGFELAYWVRRLIFDLEKWKEDHIWTYPRICMTINLRNLNLNALCELVTGLSPYDVSLAEALNCYCAAHLILARIAKGLAERSLIIRSALRPPYSLRDLVVAIVLVSQKHMSADTVGIISVIVTTFPLKVAQSTTEVGDPILNATLHELLKQVNALFARKYNINYSVSSEKGVYKP